jgi:SRSO17 transposase
VPASAVSDTETRFAAYVEDLGEAIGHADRVLPLQWYCTGLLLPGERKSVEPMAARVAPDEVRSAHQSMHHLVAAAPWSDCALLAAARSYALPRIKELDPDWAWIIDDTGNPKKGQHSVGVAKQWCGVLGKQENCQVAVTLTVANQAASLPIAHRLYLPEVWANDPEKRKKAGIPEEIAFQTKQQIAVSQIQDAIADGVPAGIVLADAAYGNHMEFRQALTELELVYAVGINGSTGVWREGEAPLPPPPRIGPRGRHAKLLRRDGDHQPTSAKELAMSSSDRFSQVEWREGSKGTMSSRFAAFRVRPSHKDTRRTEPHPEEWLLVEWPEDEAEPTKYWLSTLPADTPIAELVRITKLRWRIERDYQELKDELGLDHYEGRNWRGFHHHATLVIAAYAFLVAERAAFFPSGENYRPLLPEPAVPEGFRPRGAAGTSRAAR